VAVRPGADVFQRNAADRMSRKSPRIDWVAAGIGQEQAHAERQGDVMGNQDKLENAADEKVGQAKEALGKASGDDDLKSEGKGDQTKANLKQAGEKVKDAFK
jgi:uncharacterized protein YjbJ (UPF0337 family)